MYSSFEGKFEEGSGESIKLALYYQSMSKEIDFGCIQSTLEAAMKHGEAIYSGSVKLETGYGVAAEYSLQQDQLDVFLTEKEGDTLKHDARRIVTGFVYAGIGIEILDKTIEIAANSQQTILHTLQNLGK